MGHWYDTQGNAVHTIIGANGKERDRTLRDARKTGDANSTTGIIDILDKGALIPWMNNQILEAVIRNKPDKLVGVVEEVTTKWKSDILEESKKIGRDAANRGSKIHNALEEYIKTGDLSGSNHEYETYVMPVIDLLQETFGETDWVAEKSFYHPLGFGGTVDLHSPSKKIVIDFKTKQDKAFVKGKMGYDNHMMQLAAYGKGLGFEINHGAGTDLVGEYYNLFISSETPGILILEEWDLNDINRGGDMFTYLVEFWKLQKQYDPMKVTHDKVI